MPAKRAGGWTHRLGVGLWPAVLLALLGGTTGPAPHDGRVAVPAPRVAGSQSMSYTAPTRTGPISLVLRRDGSHLVLFDGDVPVASGYADRTSEVLIGGPDHHDTSLTVDYAFGPIRVPIGYHPGALGPETDNALTIRAGGVATESHAITGPHAGVITLDGAPIVYSNLTPITDTVPSPTLIFTALASAGTINVNTGPIVGGVQTDQINDGGTGKFELINFGNKTSVTVIGDGTTTTLFTSNIPVIASGLSTLTLVGGASGSTFDLQAIPSGLTVNVVGPDASTVNVGLGGSVAAIQGPVFISNSSGNNTVVVDDSSDPAGKTTTIVNGTMTSTGMSGSISCDAYTSSLMVLGGSGSDTFKVTPGTTPLSIDGGNPTTLPGDVLTVNTSATTSPSVSVTSMGTGSSVQGQFTFANAPSVSFKNIETLGPALDTAHFSMAATLNWPVSQPVILANTGTPPFEFAVSFGALAPGIKFDATSGALTGTPVSDGDFTATVTVTDSNGASVTATVSLTVNPPLQIAPSSLPAGTSGTPYSQTVTVTGGTKPYSTFDVTNFSGGTTGWTPSEITKNSAAGTAGISGTPTGAGTASFTVNVTDSAGAILSANYTLLVNPILQMAPLDLPPAFQGQGYSQTITVTGGTTPYTVLNVTNFNGGTTGLTPSEFTTDSAAGTVSISGTPAGGGTASFTVNVTDSAGATLSTNYTLDVAPPIPVLSTAGLFALTGLLALAGALVLRRR